MASSLLNSQLKYFVIIMWTPLDSGESNKYIIIIYNLHFITPF